MQNFQTITSLIQRARGDAVANLVPVKGLYSYHDHNFAYIIFLYSPYYDESLKSVNSHGFVYIDCHVIVILV